VCRGDRREVFLHPAGWKTLRIPSRPSVIPNRARVFKPVARPGAETGEGPCPVVRFCSGQSLDWQSDAGEEQTHRPKGRPLHKGRRVALPFQNQNRKGRPPERFFFELSAPPARVPRCLCQRGASRFSARPEVEHQKLKVECTERRAEATQDPGTKNRNPGHPARSGFGSFLGVGAAFFQQTKSDQA
jgi:hypothetical protein